MDQIAELQSKIKENQSSNDKMDLLLVRNWERSIKIIENDNIRIKNMERIL